MASEDSYRESHQRTGKGASYDDYYKTDRWAGFLWKREQQVLGGLLSELYRDRDIRLLDFACGTGRLVSFLEPHAKESTAVDVSEAMLSQARGKLRRTRLIQADLTRDNVLAGSSFNLITAFRFFLNAEEGLRRVVLQVLVSLLSDDGYLVINNHRNLSSPIIFALRAYNRLRGGTTNFMSLAALERMVRGAGLEVVGVYPVGVLSIPRLRIPDKWNDRVEDLFLRTPALAFFSESPIVVCRHRSAGTTTDAGG